MRKQLVKIISGIMMLVFFLGIAPKEYLHKLLFHHIDTVDPVYKKGEVVITVKHTHCAFLGFVFGPFVAAKKQFLTRRNPPCQNAKYVLIEYHYRYSSEHLTLKLRGPPSA